MALTDKLSAIGVAIREKTGKTALLTLDAMPAEIASITTGGGGGDDELANYVLKFTGDCSYRFANGAWNDFRLKYENEITTENITNASSMYFYNIMINNIPFEINFSTSVEVKTGSMFLGCTYLEELPVINCNKIFNPQNMFKDCAKLKKINFEVTELTGTQFNNMFEGCKSLRELPAWVSIIYRGGNPNDNAISSYVFYYYAFNNCYTLNEAIELPIYPGKMNSDGFYSAFKNAYRLKDITFTKVAGHYSPAVNWKLQNIDLSSYMGYVNPSYTSHITSNGIGNDKRVTNDTTYQALKNDDDWWTTDVAYSRYNHDSAVKTINTLPDTSAYLASIGGTNTIKFKGAAGSATDGGAINTLTDAEIAVATAKGWTVTLV